MQITIEVPDDIIEKWRAEGLDPAAIILETAAIEGYRRYQLHEYEVRRMIGLETRWQLWDLFAKYEVPRQYTAQDLAEDIAASDNLRAIRENTNDRAA